MASRATAGSPARPRLERRLPRRPRRCQDPRAGRSTRSPCVGRWVGGRGSTSAPVAVAVRRVARGSGSGLELFRTGLRLRLVGFDGFDAGAAVALPIRSASGDSTGPCSLAVSIASLAAVSEGNGPRTSGRPNSLVWVVSTMTHVPDCGSIWNRPSLVSQRPPPSRVSASGFAIDAVSPTDPRCRARS